MISHTSIVSRVPREHSPKNGSAKKHPSTARRAVENEFDLGYATEIVTTTVLSLEEWWRGFFYFLCFFAVHVFLWRKSSLPKSFVSLIAVLILLPTAIYLVFFVSGLMAAEWLSAWLLHCVLAANYIAAYPAIAAQSPTIQILNSLHRHPEGIPWSKVLESCPVEKALEDRIDELVSARLIAPDNGDYRLTRKGYCLARAFEIFRNTLGLSEGSG